MTLAKILRKHLYFDPIETLQKDSFSPLKYMDQLKETEVEPAPHPDTIYRVSRVIKLCPREEVLRHKHQVVKTQRISAKLKRTFLFGENFHLLVQNRILGPSGYLVGDWMCSVCRRMYRDQVHPGKCESGCDSKFEYIELTPKNTEHGISGHVDGVLLVNQKRTVLELKTANAMSYKTITEFERKPMESHILQMMMYMWLLKLDSGIILYFDKNESNLSQWEILYNPPKVDRVLDQLKIAREGMRTGVVPKREICQSVTCTRAKACPVAKVCFQE